MRWPGVRLPSSEPQARSFQRARVGARLSNAASFPIVVLCAPVGYGKSVALADYLDTLDGRFRRFDFSKSDVPVADILVDLQRTADDYEGVVAIDGLQTAQRDPVISAYVVELVERTKGRLRWILASRSSADLPIGTWIASGNCGFVVGPDDLAFTVEETLQAACQLACGIDDREVEALVDEAGGFPTAIMVALRTASVGDAARMRGTMRDVSYRLWSEQVYAETSEQERSLLSVASVLPAIDVRLLNYAGFDEALGTIESFRLRTSLLTETDAGLYRCSRLFSQFLRRQTELLGHRQRQGAYVRAAKAWEESGDAEAALDTFVSAESASDVLRLLTAEGFELLERGRTDVVGRAIETLEESNKQRNPRVLALRGALQSVAGNAARAEALLRRSLARASDDPDLAAFGRLRLARLIANQGKDIIQVLSPIADDQQQQEVVRAEALSLRSTAFAMAGDTKAAETDIKKVDALLLAVDGESSRAKILQRLGVAALYVKDIDRATQSLMQAGELATELQLHSIASRSWSALASLMCFEKDDVMSQLWYAERAAAAARKSGDALDIQTALFQVAAAEMRRGNAEESETIEEELQTMRHSQERACLLSAFRALRLGWAGRFREAYRELLPCWDKMHFDVDRIVCGAQCAVFLALDENADASTRLVREVYRLSADMPAGSLFRRRCVSLGLMLCTLAESVNGRSAYTGRLIAQINSTEGDPVIAMAIRMAERFAEGLQVVIKPRELNSSLSCLTCEGYADVARLIRAACDAAACKVPAVADLTAAERTVLRLLVEGVSTKEIALRQKRSVNTIRAHIANIIAKLRCHGRAQAIAMARRLDIT